MNSLHRSMGKTEWVYLIILSGLWGGSFFFVGVAVKVLPPLTIVAVRVSLAAAAIWVVVLVMKPRGGGLNRKVWGSFLIMACLNNVIPFVLIVYGQTRIASGLASILNATTPVFTVVLAHFFTGDEKLTWPKMVGAAVGLLGVIILIGPRAFEGMTAEFLAQIFVLAAACSCAVAGIYGRRFRTMNVPPMVTAAGQLTAASAVMLPLAAVVDRPWNLDVPPTGVWFALIGLAVLSSALAYVLYFKILETAGAGNLLLVTFLIPVSAVFLGVGFLGETLQTKHVLGAVTIGLGLAAIDGRLVTMWSRRRRLPGESTVSSPV